MSFGPFSDVLNLEQDFYEDGFEQGLADGEAAGLSEGRTLGLEKGFEKFCESGRLCGRSIIWANENYLHQNQKIHSVKALYALVEPETLLFENTEEAVSDFDDRLKRARARFKLIEKLRQTSSKTSNLD
ncbi:hypothetical protein EPUL_006121, partial [Erysiphe pulchra]